MLNQEFTTDDMKSLYITRTKNPLNCIPIIWKKIYAEMADNYTFIPNQSITEISNTYGVYSSGSLLVDPNSITGQQLNREINLKAQKLTSDALRATYGYNRNAGAYKTVISATLKILAHLIPNETELERLTNLSNDIENSLFYDYIVSPVTKEASEIKRLQNATIYGIYYDDELIYIGQTTREATIRFREHIKGFKEHSSELQLYRQFNIEDYTKLKFKILFTTSCGIFQHDLDNIETALIITNKPKGNHMYPGEISERSAYAPEEQTKNLIESAINSLSLILDSIQTE